MWFEAKTDISKSKVLIDRYWDLLFHSQFSGLTICCVVWRYVASQLASLIQRYVAEKPLFNSVRGKNSSTYFFDMTSLIQFLGQNRGRLTTQSKRAYFGIEENRKSYSSLFIVFEIQIRHEAFTTFRGINQNRTTETRRSFNKWERLGILRHLIKSFYRLLSW